MKLTKKQQQFLIDAHKEVCQEWKTKLENNFPKLFPKVEFEGGKWYRNGSALVCYQGGKMGYGFTKNNTMIDVEWHDNEGGWSFEIEPHYWRPATDKEVEEALIKEAKRRGFVRGVNIDYTNVSSLGGIHNTSNGGKTKHYRWNGEYLFCNGWRIFHKGKWAKLIETITKEEAEKELGKKILC